MDKTVVSFDKLNKNQKINYIKSTLFKEDLNSALDSILKNEKKDLSNIKLIQAVLKDKLILDRIKEQCNFLNDKDTKLFVYSKIMSVLSFYNKQLVLSNFLKNLSKDELKEVSIYEYNNKTDLSLNNKTFKKYAKTYENEATEVLKLDDEEKKLIKKESEKYNNITNKKAKPKKRKYMYIILVLALLIVGNASYKTYENYKLVDKYRGEFLPGIYLNDTELVGMKISDIDKEVRKQKEELENGSLNVANINGDHIFKYKDLGMNIDAESLIKEIKEYYDNLNFFDKVYLVKNKGKFKVFYLKGNFPKMAIDNLMATLKEKLNTEPKDDGVIVDKDHNVYYDAGCSGFVMDEKKTKEAIMESFKNLKANAIVNAIGKETKNEVKYDALKDINKKISTHTTYFVNAGNRGHNINLATNKLNGTVIMPGETFSYLKYVGPYGKSNGYLPAPVYVNNGVGTDYGGGVCQLASTLYNAQLKAGFETVERSFHMFAPDYVKPGLDATVYGTTVDYKFKNQYKYPIYIVSYVQGNYLTVDIWSNENELEGKSFEPYSTYSSGGYLSYLNIIKDGNVIETKYLGKSYYQTH